MPKQFNPLPQGEDIHWEKLLGDCHAPHIPALVAMLASEHLSTYGYADIDKAKMVHVYRRWTLLATAIWKEDNNIEDVTVPKGYLNELLDDFTEDKLYSLAGFYVPNTTAELKIADQGRGILETIDLPQKQEPVVFPPPDVNTSHLDGPIFPFGWYLNKIIRFQNSTYWIIRNHFRISITKNGTVKATSASYALNPPKSPIEKVWGKVALKSPVILSQLPDLQDVDAYFASTT